MRFRWLIDASSAKRTQRDTTGKTSLTGEIIVTLAVRNLKSGRYEEQVAISFVEKTSLLKNALSKLISKVKLHSFIRIEESELSGEEKGRYSEKTESPTTKKPKRGQKRLLLGRAAVPILVC